MKKDVKLSNILPSTKFWMQTVTKRVRKLKKDCPDNPFLSHDEKTILFLDWKNNKNVKSRDKLLETLYPLALQLVHDLVNKLGNNNVLVEDLEQEANYALLYTLTESEYDPSLGTLPTYFRSRLPMFFFRALKDYGNIIRIPDNILKDISSENKAFDLFVKTNGRYPEMGETYIYKDKINQFGEKKIDTIVSGNKSVNDEEETAELFDLIGTEDETNEQFVKNEALLKIVNSLSKQEQEIINLTYFSDMEVSEIVYELKPYTRYDRERLYKRSKNTLKIKTNEGETCYNFFVYKGAKKRSLNEVKTTLRPISHPFSENYQEFTTLNMCFAAKEVVSITLNNEDITDKLILIENDSFDTLNTNDKLFQLNCTLKAGTIYSLQNYNNKVNQIKDKIRKKIVKHYEYFK